MSDHKSTGDKIADDLAQTQPDWAVAMAKSATELQEKADAALDEYHADNERDTSPISDEADPKIGGDEKTQKARSDFRVSVQELADERERLVSERSYLIDVLGVDPDELEPIDGAEAVKAIHEAHPLRFANGGIVPPGARFYERGMRVPPDFSPVPPSVPKVDVLIDKETRRVLDEAVTGIAELIQAEAARESVPSGAPLCAPSNAFIHPPRSPLNEPHGAPSMPEVDPKDYEWDGDKRGKDSNPKDAIGSRKAGLSMLPRQVLYEVALGMLEGALKYARHNYRIAGVRASVYMDANSRHMDAWWEGQDMDPGSGLHHVVKAIASLVVLRDSMLAGNWYDDRPPSIGDPNWLEYYNTEAERIIDEFEGEPKKPYIKGDNV